MPNKHRRNESNPMSGIRNLYSSSDGLMHNLSAENKLNATINQRSSILGKTLHLPYGGNYDSYYCYSIKDFQSNKINQFMTRDGKIITRQDIDYMGRTSAGLIQEGKNIDKTNKIINILQEAIKSTKNKDVA